MKLTFQVGRMGITDAPPQEGKDEDKPKPGPLFNDPETERYITKMEPKSDKGQLPVFRMELAAWKSTRQFFLIRGWREWNPKEGNRAWNIYWRENRVGPFVIKNCLQCQRINKFRDSGGITLKDTLAARMSELEAKFGSVYSFVPKSWVFPDQKEEFVEQLRKGTEANSQNGSSKKQLFICKPARLSRGRNIFLFQSAKELETKLEEANPYTSTRTREEKEVEKWVVQSYLSNPFLISGYKFDLRLYVLVTNVWPLEAFIYKRGLVRFATSPFDLSSSGDLYKHLTNSSINKDSKDLNAQKGVIGKGCKWRLKRLLEYLRENNKDADKVWKDIKDIVLLTLVPMVGHVPADPCAFEYFGFDVMLDDNLKPYVIEVNSGPAMSMDMPEDKVVKVPMVNDLFNLLQLEKIVDEPSKPFPQYRRSRRSKTSRQDGKSTQSTSESKEGGGGPRRSPGLNLKLKGDWDVIYPTSWRGEKISEAEKIGCLMANDFDTIGGKRVSNDKEAVSQEALDKWIQAIVSNEIGTREVTE